MLCKWLKKQMSYYCKNDERDGYNLYALGPLEITLIVVAVILVFGVGKIAHIGGALGRSIREFRQEKDGIATVPKLATKETKKEGDAETEVKSEGESKD